MGKKTHLKIIQKCIFYIEIYSMYCSNWLKSIICIQNQWKKKVSFSIIVSVEKIIFVTLGGLTYEYATADIIVIDKIKTTSVHFI